MVTATTLTPRTIGETENALRALLVDALSGSGLDYHRWVALTLIARSDPALDQTSVTARLVDVLKIDFAAASTVVGDLEFRGLTEEHGGVLQTTAEGAAFFERVSAEVNQLTKEIWSGIDPADLAVGSRVLTTLTERANALLAR